MCLKQAYINTVETLKPPVTVGENIPFGILNRTALSSVHKFTLLCQYYASDGAFLQSLGKLQMHVRQA